MRVTGDGAVPEVPVMPEVEEESTAWIVDAVREAIEALPDGQREVVAMHKLEGMPLAEVAERLGIREGAARVRAHRGYNRLRAALAGIFSREA